MRANPLAKAVSYINGSFRRFDFKASSIGTGSYIGTTDGTLETVACMDAMKLSAWYACLRLRAETIGTLPFRLIERKTNKEITDHPVYDLIANRPNAFQTGAEFVSAMVLNFDVFGNATCIISKFANGSPYNLEFIPTDFMEVALDKLSRPSFGYEGTALAQESVLHIPNFSQNGYWGLPALLAAQQSLGMQVASNRAAAATFKGGMRIGGFFKPAADKQAMTGAQIAEFYANLREYYKPENTSRWFMLPNGIEPIDGRNNVKIDPVSAELLNSRYFGIEELCRFLAVPPPLIGQTNKASSWASSLDSLNQHLVTYSLLPTTIRMEDRIAATLLTARERNRFRVNFNVDALLRGDIKTRFDSYKIGIDSQVYTPDEVRAKEKMPPREDGKGSEVVPRTGAASNNVQENENA